MSKPVVIITGSSGRIGRAVASRFAPHFQLVGFDFVASPESPNTLDYVKVDLSSDESVAAGFVHVKEKYGENIASVIHLAAYYNFTGERTDKYEKITVQGTARMLKNLQHFKCEQFMFSSTMLVHAPCSPGSKICENSPLLGLWDYPRSKIETEAVMRKERGSIPIVIARIAGVYDDYCNSIPLSTQMQRIYEKQFAAHVYPGDVNRGTSYLHMNDLVDFIELAVQKRGQLPSELTLLVGEGQLMTYAELQKLFEELIFGAHWKLWPIPKPIAKIGAFLQNITGQSYIKPWMIDIADIHYDLDISLAQETLGWTPRHFVKDTAPHMVAALKQDPIGWYTHHALVMPHWMKRAG